MARNVEIKVRVDDPEKLRRRAAAAAAAVEGRASAEAAPIVLRQHDTFYHVPGGRMKLRRSGDDPPSAELILYERTDGAELRESRYVRLLPADGASPSAREDDVSILLGRMFPVRGVVSKRREVYLIGQTRVHLDSVEGLGDYAEVEVVLNTDQSVEWGRKVGGEIIAALGLEGAPVEPRAYIDLLEAKQGTPRRNGDCERIDNGYAVQTLRAERTQGL